MRNLELPVCWGSLIKIGRQRFFFLQKSHSLFDKSIDVLIKKNCHNGEGVRPPIGFIQDRADSLLLEALDTFCQRQVFSLGVIQT